ncbi:hypothetical protein BC937DRAFT_86935 [Endogone sp. FLAS-F59071]|nr:hypothetical protein BC937DRAFT_86935 [Endogone sp. FLAS-F59071]|eukprot:RUS12819.1 hypothetical protein BC937DRAFT_86935 [Endogone sp. FLAS-F59071]
MRLILHISPLLLLFLLAACSRIDAADKASSSYAKASSSHAKASSSHAKVSSTHSPAPTPAANGTPGPVCGQCNAMHIMLLGCQIFDASTATAQQVGCFCTQAFVNNFAACTACVAHTDTTIPLLIPSVQFIITGCNNLLSSTSHPSLQPATGPGTTANNTIVLPPPGYIGSNWSVPVGSVQTTLVATVSQTGTPTAGTSAGAAAGRMGGLGVGMIAVMVAWMIGMV